MALPEVPRINLGKSAGLVSALSICYPFIRTGMTDEYADNPKVFGRWQPRMLEPYEAAESFLDLLSRPAEQTAGGIYELLVDGTPQALDISWRRVKLAAQPEEL
jgi:hypothetical protein